MARKDFVAIANVIKSTRMDGVTREELITNMVKVLSKDPRFKEALFRKACQPDTSPL